MFILDSIYPFFDRSPYIKGCSATVQASLSQMIKIFPQSPASFFIQFIGFRIFCGNTCMEVGLVFHFFLPAFALYDFLALFSSSSSFNGFILPFSYSAVLLSNPAIKFSSSQISSSPSSAKVFTTFNTVSFCRVFYKF